MNLASYCTNNNYLAFTVAVATTSLQPDGENCSSSCTEEAGDAQSLCNALFPKMVGITLKCTRTHTVCFFLHFFKRQSRKHGTQKGLKLSSCLSLCLPLSVGSPAGIVGRGLVVSERQLEAQRSPQSECDPCTCRCWKTRSLLTSGLC